MFVVPVFARTRPRAGRYSSRCASVPVMPATASESRTSGRSFGSFQIATQERRELAGGDAVRAREARAVDDADAGERDARGREVAPDDRGAGGRRALAEHLAADRLQHELGREVVAVGVDRLQQAARAAASRPSRAGPRSGRARPVCASRASIPRAAQHAVEQRRGGERGVARPGGRRASRGRRRAPRAAATPMIANDGSQPVTVQRRSNHESSPTMWPVTRRMPRAAIRSARRPMSVAESVGSP